MFALNDLIDWHIIEKIRGEKILLVGLNDWSKFVMLYFLKHNIPIEGFFLTDRQHSKKTMRYLNKPMFFSADLCSSEKYFLINASEEKISFELPSNITILNLWSGENFKKLCDQKNDEGFCFEELQSQYLGINKPHYLNYIIHCSMKKNIILCGNLKNAVDLAQKFKLLEVRIEEMLDTENFIGKFDDYKFISPYDLFYMDENKFLVVVLPQAEEFILNFLNNSGFNPALFIRYEDIRRFDKPVCFDPNLGYNLKNSLTLLKRNQCETKKILRIGVIGGSTSDSAYFAEKSWVEHLVDIGGEKKISLQIYNGAVRGYSVSLELIKFVRDMAHLKLDFLFSVSGINEEPCATKENPFITKYQKIIFEQVAASRPKNFRRHMDNSVCYGDNPNDLVNHWISTERMINAIAKECGMRFYAILQPGLLTKAKFSDFDKEVMEHWFDESKVARYEVLKNIRKELRKVNLPWIKDFTGLFDEHYEQTFFDGCHLLSNANRYFAEKIFALIEKDIRGGFF